MAKSALEFLHGGSHPMEAAEKAVAYLKEKADGKGGLIIVDNTGRVGYSRNTSHMPICMITGPEKVITDS